MGKEYQYADLVGQEVEILTGKFKSGKGGADGIVVLPRFDSDKVFVHVYYISDVVPFDRSLLRTQKDKSEALILVAKRQAEVAASITAVYVEGFGGAGVYSKRCDKANH